MTSRTDRGLSSHPPSKHPAVRHYTLFCLAALFLQVVCLADRGLDWWCLLPALIGGVALLAHWSMGPPLLLLSLTGLMHSYQFTADDTALKLAPAWPFAAAYGIMALLFFTARWTTEGSGQGGE